MRLSSRSSKQSSRHRRLLAATSVAVTMPLVMAAGPPATPGSAEARPSRHPVTAAGVVTAPVDRWVGTWQTAQQPPTGATWQGPNWSQAGFADHSIRQVTRASIGGARIRIRLSNAYGRTPLRLTGATVGKAGPAGTVRPGSLRSVRFGGSTHAVISPGAEKVSGAVELPTVPLERLAVTLHFAAPTGPATFHEFAAATTYRAAGDHRFDESAAAFTETGSSWYYLAGVDVAGAPPAGRSGTASRSGLAGDRAPGDGHAIVAFGDSITDGVGATRDADNRYPDELAERLAVAGRPVGVLNAGIGGNRILNDSSCYGEQAIDRFTRDVLGQTRARTVIVLEGINDIGFSEVDIPCATPNPRVTADQLIHGYRELIRTAHGRGMAIVGATLTPFKGAGYYTEAGERVRDAVNHWIRTSGEYDAVVDLDRTLADPADPDRLRADYDAGDRLHPSDAGYRAMAAAIDLDTLSPTPRPAARQP